MALLLDSLVDPEVATNRLGSPTPRPELRADLFAALDVNGAQPFTGFRRRFAKLFDISLNDAATILGRMTDSEVWLPLGAVSLYHFEPGPKYEGAHAGLVRCQPGNPFPTHRHLGTETTMILAGSIRDDDSGEVYFPGDVITVPGDTVHHLSIEPPRECVFAVLMEGGFPDFD